MPKNLFGIPVAFSICLETKIVAKGLFCMRFLLSAMFVLLCVAGCRHLYWDSETHFINENILIHENKDGHFWGTAGLDFSKDEIVAHIESEACSPGERVVEYEANILTSIPNPRMFEGRCG